MTAKYVFPGLVAVLSIALMLIGVLQISAAKSGIEISERNIQGTPVKSYQIKDARGPLVVIAHGFSGSIKMVEALSITLTRAGYRVTSLDLPGHGDNAMPMSANVTEIDGATVQLKQAIAAVVDAERERLQTTQPVVLAGHSMSTDFIIRLSDVDPRIGPLIAISMYSDLVSETVPKRMLIVSGEYEPGLREIALNTVRMIEPTVQENEFVESPAGDIRRGAFVAPGVEHVGVLYSERTLATAVEWLDAEFGITREAPINTAFIGVPILFATIGAFALFWPITRFLGASQAPLETLKAKPLWSVVLVPAIATPLLLFPFRSDFVPMIGMSYFAAHLAVYGLIALALLWRAGIKPRYDGWHAPVLLLAYAIGIIAVIIDRAFTDFLPSTNRLLPMVLIAAGTIPFMMADSLLVKTSLQPWWMRFVTRLVFFVSLIAAIAIFSEGRLMIGFYLPVVILFFLVFGSMARWLHQRDPAPTMSGVAQGLLLAYSLAAIVPMISANVG